MTKGQFRMLRCGVAGVEAIEAETRHTFARHTHEQFGIGVLHRGAQKSRSGRGMVEAGAGDTITVNPGEVHDGAPLGGDVRSWRILYFEPALIAEALGDMREARPGACEFPRPVVRDAAVAARFQRLFTLMTTDDRTSLQHEESLLLLLADVMRERSSAREKPAVPDAIARAKGLIDDDPTAPITLADLARASGSSRFQVLRAFAAATGLTPHAYLVQRRVHLARRLIAEGTPLAEAAAAAGFADQSHMTRIFVRKYGVSPRVYANARQSFT